MNNPFHKFSSKRMLLSCTKSVLVSLTVILAVISCSGKAGTAEAVDLGLPSGTLWASFNLGASKPSGRGGYFAWGESEAKSVFEWSNLKYCEYVSSDKDIKFSKYVLHPEYGTVDGKTVLEPEDDAAAVNWGDGWRIPSVEEWAELKDQCEWQWKEKGTVDGFEITGRNGNSIFLPAVGHCLQGDTIHQVGEFGIYSSSTIFTGENPFGIKSNTSMFNERYCCYFSNATSSPTPLVSLFPRCSGFSVRPVKSGERAQQ